MRTLNPRIARADGERFEFYREKNAHEFLVLLAFLTIAGENAMQPPRWHNSVIALPCFRALLDMCGPCNNFQLLIVQWVTQQSNQMPA